MMRQEVWIKLRLPIGVDSGARYHRDDVLDHGAQGRELELVSTSLT